MNFKDENITEPSGEFAAAIRDFRAAVTHVAERETARPAAVDWLTPARQRRRRHQHRMILAWGCAAALCCATLPFAIMPLGTHSGPVYINIQQQVPASAALVPPTETGTGLLEQVDEQVSESVPSSLAPLAEPENWNTTSTPSSGLSLDGTALVQMEQTNAAH